MNKERMETAGIHYTEALERFVGNVNLYQKYVTKFLDDTHVADAEKAFAQGDLAEVLSQVHALKGLAGTLGMTPLYEASAEVVRELRDEKEPVLEEKMRNVKQEYERMIEAIRG